MLKMRRKWLRAVSLLKMDLKIRKGSFEGSLDTLERTLSWIKSNNILKIRLSTLKSLPIQITFLIQTKLSTSLRRRMRMRQQK
jgi:hypothetical protein